MQDLDNINLFDKQPEETGPHEPGENPSRPLNKSGTNIIISGTCAGIAEYFNTDPVIIRIVFLLGLLFGAWIAGLYLVAAFMLPPEKNPRALTDEESESIRSINFRTVLSGTLLFAGLYLAFRFFGLIERFHFFYFSESISIAILSVAAGVFFILKNPPVNSRISSAPKKFLRSARDARISGVCGGFAEYTNFDSSSLRILFLLIFFLTAGIFGIFYLLIALAVPREEPGTDA